MPLTAILLVLAAAVTHAAWNLLAKRVRGGMETVWLYSSIGTLMLAPWALYAYAEAWPRLGAREAYSLAGSCFWQLIYFVCLQQAYKHGDLSLVYPVARGAGPLIASVGAMLVLGESAPLTAWIGIAMISGGVLFFLQFGGGPRTAILWGLATGVIIGVYSLWDKYAISGLGLAPIMIEWTTDASRAITLAPVARGKWREAWRASPFTLCWIALLNPLAYIFVLSAMQLAPLHRVAPMRELSIVLGTVLGARLLGEPQSAHRISGACVIAAGVFFLSIA
ncbi:MAG: EamA family transporter [Acidobacteria bacterium]|nr:EamA family transporter [Acidobacteriota bacterium]